MEIKRSPNVSFDIVRTNIPGLNLPPAPMANPFTNIPLTGDHVEFEELQVTFKCDELLTNYFDLHNWIRGLGFTDNFDQYKALHDKSYLSGLGLTSELVVLFLNSSRNPIMAITYHDTWPTQLSGLTYDVSLPNVQYLNAICNFRYSTFDHSSGPL